MVMIIHKCVLRDINKYLVKQGGEMVGLNKVNEISSRILNSESLNRNTGCDISKLFGP